jgi:outer membrane protein insertion porin family
MTFSTILRWSLGLIALGAFSAYSLSQAPETALPAKKVVREVRVITAGGAQIDENRIRANMGTRVGQAFEEDTVERDIKNLYATGLVESVEVTTQDVKGGVAVIVKVTGRGAIGEVAFAGNSVFESDRLRKEIDVKVNEPVDEAKLFAGANKIRDLYAKKGYSDVGVDYKTQPLPTAGFVRVVYNITEGQRGIINDIRFEGLTAVKEGAMRSKMKLKEKRIWHLWGKAGKLNNEELQEDIRTIERTVQDKGYVYAKVVQVRREPIKDDRVDIVFVVDEGKQYGVSDVSLEGNTVFTKEELTPALLMEAGAPYSATDISADEKMLSDYYGSRGYAEAHIDTSVVPSGTDTVKIVYRVSEGEKYFIRKINIEGNTKSKDYVIRRELAFAPGEEFNTVRIEKTRNRLQNMGYFSQVDIRNNATGTPGYKDIDINVIESSTGNISVGVGFSSIDSFVGFFSLTQTNFDIRNWPNFTGAGQRFNLDVRYGDKRRDFSVSLVEPWFLGQRLSLGGEIFYRDLYYLSDVYDQQNYGGAINLRKPIGEHSYVELSYTAQKVKIHNLDDDVSQEILDEEGDFFESKFDLSFTHDTRDNVFLTRKGHKFTIAGLATAGGDVDAYGGSIEAAQYFTLPYDFILSFEGAARTVSGDAPIFERLFLGGANNLRGFEYREVGPKDENGEPLGGDTSFYLTAEVSFPIVEKVRGAVFYDVGEVSGGPGDFGGGLNSDVGIGLRLFFLPTGPIRLDFGIPINSDEFNDSSGQFNFNLGYRF